MTSLTMQFDSINNTWSYEEQPQMQVEVILASAPRHSPYHKTLFTVRLRYPRPLHGEVMTHRKFGRNARSSRAVPVKTMLKEVRTTPYVPWHWGLNQSGMQADQECDELVDMGLAWYSSESQKVSNEEAWVKAADFAAYTAEAFMEAGYHKQNPNRLLEPFSWIDTLITSSDWDNFLWLREHGAAEPHLQDLAALVHAALEKAVVQDLGYGEWHIPYITKSDWIAADTEAKPEGMTTDDFLLRVSSARCARISYTPFNGNPSYERELERYDMLVTSDRVHASPTEHQASPDELILVEVSQIDEDGEDVEYLGTRQEWRKPDLHGNLTGYIQYRKLIPNECYTGRII